MITFDDVKKNPYILEFIRQTDIALEKIGYTDHGIRHAELVSERARNMAKEIGLAEREQELCAIAGYCHDMGNFLSRSQHHYWASMLFSQIFGDKFPPQELANLMQAIANHDRQEMDFTDEVSSITVLADKSDVSRSRVRQSDIWRIKTDIHDRVNYAVEKSTLKVDRGRKEIKLVLKIDTDFCPIIEFFAIFTERMMYCQRGAEYLGYKFGIEVNNFTLL